MSHESKKMPKKGRFFLFQTRNVQLLHGLTDSVIICALAGKANYYI